MYPFFYDSTFLILIPGIILAMYAQSKVKSTYAKFVKVPTIRQITGFETARMILDRNGLSDVQIEQVRGNLTDHYDPRSKVLRLSSEVYNKSTIASNAVAAHEVGHAIQHAQGYIPLTFRNLIFPVAQFGSSLSWIFILAGILLSWTGLIDIGIILFSVAVLFQVVTLPVEFNASSRALVQLEQVGVLSATEVPSGKKVLDAAALTYVAATASAILSLVRLLIIRGNND